MTYLNVDDDYVTLKKIHYLVTGNTIEDVLDTRSVFVQIANECTPNNDSVLNACCNVQRSIVTKHNRLHDEVLG